jgi:hypothetical protein
VNNFGVVKEIGPLARCVPQLLAMPRVLVFSSILALVAGVLVACASPPVGSTPSGNKGAASSDKKKSTKQVGDDDDDDDGEPQKSTSSAQKSTPPATAPTPAPEGAACSAKIPCGSGLSCMNGICQRPDLPAPNITGNPPPQQQQQQQSTPDACLKLGSCCGRMTDTVDRLTCSATAASGNDSACNLQLVVCLSGGLDLGGALGGLFGGGTSSGGTSGGLSEP